jgi:hypothetical protein
MKKTLLLIGVLLLSGCTAFKEGFNEGLNRPAIGREKYGASSEEFANVRYQCLQQASGRVSSAQSNQQGAVFNSGTACNYNLYDACMQSKGWTNQPGGRFTQDSGCQ